MPCRITYVFQNSENIWRENWYSTDTDVENSLAGAVRLAPLRQAMLGTFTTMTQVKAVNLDRLNQSAVKVFDQTPPGAGAEARFVTDTAWNAILCRVTANDGGAWYHRPMWLRGIPDSWITYDTNNQPVISGNATVLCNAFGNGMTKQGGYKLYVRCVNRTGGANPRLPVTAVTRSTTTPSLINLAVANAPYAVGDVVSVRGCQGSNLKQNPPGRKGVNGRWIVVNTTTTLVTISLPSSYLPGVPSLRVMGTVRSNNMTYAPVQNITPLYVSSRATAGFRGGQRGAKRRRPESIPSE